MFKTVAFCDLQNKMAVIMINTAVSSSFFVLGLIFAFLSVHSTFTVVSGTGVVPNVTFGLTLVGSSLGLFTTGKSL